MDESDLNARIRKAGGDVVSEFRIMQEQLAACVRMLRAAGMHDDLIAQALDTIAVEVRNASH